MNNSFEENQTSSYDTAREKSRRYGFFSLTAQDHEDMNSTPGDELTKNPGKAQYELMSDEEIMSYLDGALEAMNDADLIKNGYAQQQRDFLITSIPFLEGVGRLPEKYKGFDLNT